MSTITDSSEEQTTPLVRDRTLLVLLGLVLAATLGGGWLLNRALHAAPNQPPPLLPFILIFIGVLGLLIGRQQQRPLSTTQTTNTDDATTPPLHPLLTHLGFSALPAGVELWQILAVAGSLLLTVTILLQLPRHNPTQSYLSLFVAWLLAGVLFVAAVSPPSRAALRRRWQALPDIWRRHRPAILLLGLIILIALLLRLINLGTVPQTLGGDEGSQGLEAVRVLRREIRNPFTTGWLGVPTMSFFYNSIGILLFGTSNFALRLPWALVGVATVAANFFLVRRLTNVSLALLSTALLAVYHYHIHYSRLGSVQISDTLFVVLALLFLYRALDEERPFDWALTGIISALALYFYAGARFVPIVVGAVLFYRFLREPRRFLDRHLSGVFILIVAFLVIGAPMLQYAVRFPDDFNARLNQVGIFQSGWLENEVAQPGNSYAGVLFDQFRRSVLAYNFYPDRTVWYGLRAPLFDAFFGALFLLGLGYGTLRMLGDERAQRLAPMVAWWWGGIILGGMLTESPPSSQRLVTTSVPACFFVALALDELARLAEGAIAGVPRRAVLAFSAVAFAVISLQTYFLDYTPQRIYGGQHAELATDLAPLLNQLDETHYSYFFGPPWMYWGFSTIPYMAPDMPGEDVTEALQAPPPADWLPPGRGGLFIFLPQRSNELGLIQQTFPNGEIRQLRAQTNNRVMAVLYVVPPP